MPSPVERIAVISDLHGNLPALEAVLADIGRRDVTRILCLGDLVGKGPHSAQTLDISREVCAATVRGNWDDFVATGADAPPSVAWHREQLGPERLRYLAALPPALDFGLSGRQVRLLHASAIGVYHRVHQYDTREAHAAMFANTPFTGDGQPPDIVGYGDIHSAYVHSFDGRILFNAGSVGNPLDMTLAAYALIEGSASPEPAPFDVRLARVPYDIERAIWDAEQSGMPDMAPYRNELRTARYRGLAPLSDSAP